MCFLCECTQYCINCIGCSNRNPVAVRCSLVERSTAVGRIAAVGQSPADTVTAVDCTESYLEICTNTRQILII